MLPIIRSEKQLAAAIRRFRKAAGMTQGDLATKASKRQATISNLESGSGTLDTLFSTLGALELELVLQPRTQSRAPDLADLF